MGANGAAAVQALLQRRPEVTALFAINDERALEALAGLDKFKYQIPHDLSIIGQDNVPERMGSDPILTTVGFPHADVGYLAAELLVKQMDNALISHCNLWVCCTLVERTSCANRRADRTPTFPSPDVVFTVRRYFCCFHHKPHVPGAASMLYQPIAQRDL